MLHPIPKLQIFPVFSTPWGARLIPSLIASLALGLGACTAQDPEPVAYFPAAPTSVETSPTPETSPETVEALETPEPETTEPAIAIPEGWVAYTAPDDSFAIAFPDNPETQTIPTINAKYDGGSQFYYARADYPDPPKAKPSQQEVREYLELVMPGLARAFGGDLIDYWEGLRLGGHEGRRMVFKNKQGIQFETRFFFDATQGRLFVATFGLTDDNIAVPDAQKFFKSFHIGQ